MKMQFLLSFLLAWLCVGISIADDDSGDITKYKYELEISGASVKITCPSEAKQLTKKGKADVLATDGVYKKDPFSADDNGEYVCDGKQLYLKAYVCETCIEVSVLLVAGILIADCLVTLGISLFIYFGCKRKSAGSNEMAPGGRNNRGNKERPPPVPHPDYEPLQKRGQVVYDGLNKNFK